MKTAMYRQICCFPEIVAFVVVVATFANVRVANCAEWSLTYLDDTVLNTTGAGFTVAEMSGVAYAGSSPIAGNHRFVAVQDTGFGIVEFDVEFSPTGDINATSAKHLRPLDNIRDFEGIVLNDSSVFLSEENNPGIQEYSIASGAELQDVTIPAVFSNVQGNFGFESLTRSADGTKIWTANEGALTVDGPLATASDGTTVRLLEMNVSGNTLTPGQQFAYEVDPIHDAFFPDRSGLSELIALPDGTLLALERSGAFGTPLLESRIYEIDFTGATDVSVAPFDAGLDGETFTPVTKELLWSGAAGGGDGQNLEGLALGPPLPNGDWILLGVVDSGDPVSSNTVISFQLSASTFVPTVTETGDFDQDGDVDGKDFLAWQRGVNLQVLPGVGDGDGNQSATVDGTDLGIWEGDYGLVAAPPITADFDQDGDVDGADHLAWQRGFGNGTTLAEGDSDASMSVDGADHANWESMFGDGVGPLATASAVPEPGSAVLLIFALGLVLVRRR